MLRSFAYAAATLAMSVEATIDLPTRELRSARWERDVRAAYLAGYLADGDDDAPGILPETSEHVRLLIALFESEKAFYELTYELNNRPDWAWIPMRGIAKLFTKSS
jgi:maltose alpha-D-glucosyltransferase / alpha-amylase